MSPPTPGLYLWSFLPDDAHAPDTHILRVIKPNTLRRVESFPEERSGTLWGFGQQYGVFSDVTVLP